MPRTHQNEGYPAQKSRVIATAAAVAVAVKPKLAPPFIRALPHSDPWRVFDFDHVGGTPLRQFCGSQFAEQSRIYSYGMQVGVYRSRRRARTVSSLAAIENDPSYS